MECAICNSIVELIPFKSDDFNHYHCSSCDYDFFIQKKINISPISEIYENDIDYINDLSISKNYKDLIQWNHRIFLKFIKNKSIKAILDVGTYNGFLVKFLRDNQLKAYGIDFNPKSINSGILNYKLKGYISTEISDFKIEKFDCILAFEVIEHVPNPTIFIEDMKKYLSNNGLIVLSCPNKNMMWRPPLDFPPHHLSRFSPNSLSILLEKNGFEIIQLKEQMSLFDLLRNSIGLLFRDTQKASLKGGGFKNSKLTNVLKKILNRTKTIAYIAFYPFDRFMHFWGFRYMSQVIIAQYKK